MEEIALGEPEEQQLKERTPKPSTEISSASLELQETEYNDNDRLADDDNLSYKFSRRDGMKVKYGHLTPLLCRKDGSPRVLLGPDCRQL